MPRRHHRSHPALPRLWLMTDERMGDALWRALAALPRGAGIVFRHHATAPAQRRALFERVRRVAHRRGLALFLAGSAEQAIAWRADGVHGRSRNSAGPRLDRTAPVHDMAQIARAKRVGADLMMLSPVFATRSHPGAGTLGRWRFAALTTRAEARVVALGGMSARRGRMLAALGAYGWAAIDAWSQGDGG